MWQVLLEANYSNWKTTLGTLKRFLYVVEGLDKQEHPQQLQTMFIHFKPFQINRLSSQSMLRHQCEPAAAATFQPKISPRGQKTKSQYKQDRKKNYELERNILL